MYAKVGNFVSSTLQLRKPRTRHPLLLPPEIILLILHHMSTADAVQVALASFHMKVMAEEHMYRHVNLSNCRVRTALFLSTLQQRPELGSLIETISVYKRPIPIIFKPEVHFSSLTQERFREVLLPSLWNQLLCAASRLRAIDVTLDTYDLFLENPELNDQHVRHLATASDRLETLAFHWWTYSKTTYKPRAPIPYAAIGRLLGYHASLTHLEISGLKKIDPLLGTDLPNLHTIIAHCNVVAAIIPGRPIRSITAFHHAPSGDDEINIHGVYSKFTKSTAPITYLKIDLFSGASVSAEANTIETLMQYLAGVLPHVEHLAFETDARYNTRLDHAAYAAIARLNSLHTLECLIGEDVPSQTLFSYCPSLQEVHTRDGRYTRNSQETTTTFSPPPFSPSFKSLCIPFDNDLPTSLLDERCMENEKNTVNCHPSLPFLRKLVYFYIFFNVLLWVWLWYWDVAIEWDTLLLSRINAQLYHLYSNHCGSIQVPGTS